MTIDLTPPTARALIRTLRQRGCVWRCGHCQTVIPVHAGDLTPATLRSIERDLEACLGPKWLTK
jgi:hypothetical protein